MYCILTEAGTECRDSVLTTAANILGILTFACGVFLSFTALVTITRNADNEVQDLSMALNRTDIHLGDINAYLAQLEIERDPILKEMRPTVTSSYRGFLQARDDIRDYLKEFAPEITQEQPKPSNSMGMNHSNTWPQNPPVPTQDGLGCNNDSYQPSQGPRKSSSLWTRSKWWYHKKETAAKMARLESCRQHFNAIQLTLIARKMEQQKLSVESLRRAVDSLAPKTAYLE
ncbi:hypothetical protein CDV36_013524 [Fusarium kuroshium]|uniref:Uncharacterized protein n=1 Tax=Fusarium kuroshium TaxID=2010991 RepID=A0A3M2RNH0_9HYPO|nr:hypothetical protein CDV36_013524 [Fusarium kuroshium]